jgi:hypothetical protein
MKQRGYTNWLLIDLKLKKIQTWDAICPIPYIMISLTLFTFKNNFITGEAMTSFIQPEPAPLNLRQQQRSVFIWGRLKKYKSVLALPAL